MGFWFWKSSEERRIERDMQVRKGMHVLERQVGGLDGDLKDYKKLAIEAKRAGAGPQLKTVKEAMKRTLMQVRLCRQQLIAIKTAQKIKVQAEGHSEFAKSMNAVSRSIADVFGSTDFAATQKNFEKAMAQADSMQQRMEIFLESASDSMAVGSTAEGLVSDEEIDQMIDDEAVAKEKDALDERVSKGLDRVREELGR